MKTVIKCGSFFSAKDALVEKDVAVTVEDNKIVAVCPAAEADCADAQVIDLSDKFVMPGLIDAHMHLNMNGEADSTAAFPSLNAADLAYTSMVYAQRDLMAGFTTVRDEGSYEFTDVALRNAISKGIVWGPRIFCSGASISSTGGHGDSHFNPAMHGGEFSSIVNSPDEARAAARYAFKYGADQLKLMATGGVMSFGDEPGAPELTYEEMKAALDVANSRGKISSAHAHGAEGIKNAIRAGITSIEHGMLIDDEGIDMLVEYGVYLIPTIIAAERIVVCGVESGIPDYAVAKAKVCLENHADHLKVMMKKGVKIGFGTDTGTPYSMHGKQAYEFQLMVEAGIPAEYCLQAATRINSELLRWNDRIGTIEPGKLADIVAFNENPMENIKTMCDCAFVMKDGVVYKQ